MAKQRILDAAAALAEEEGVNSLSLERVAERAGVSKGGLLYHFHTKEAMMTALMQNTIDWHEEVLADRVRNGESYVSAVITGCLDKATKVDALMPAFVAAVANDRAALEMIRAHRQVWQHRLENEGGLSHSKALILGLVLDGMMIGQGLGVSDLSDSDRQSLMEGLLDFVAPSEKERLAEWFRAALALPELAEA